MTGDCYVKCDSLGSTRENSHDNDFKMKGGLLSLVSSAMGLASSTVQSDP